MTSSVAKTVESLKKYWRIYFELNRNISADVWM